MTADLATVAIMTTTTSSDPSMSKPDAATANLEPSPATMVLHNTNSSTVSQKAKASKAAKYKPSPSSITARQDQTCEYSVLNSLIYFDTEIFTA
jgi:hypothetical protein